MTVDQWFEFIGTLIAVLGAVATVMNMYIKPLTTKVSDISDNTKDTAVKIDKFIDELYGVKMRMERTETNNEDIFRRLNAIEKDIKELRKSLQNKVGE